MKIKAKAGIRGNIKMFKLAPNVSQDDLKLVREFSRTGNEYIKKGLVERGVLLDYKEQHNIIVTRGRAVLAERLAGGTTYTGEINYGALGTGISPVPTNASVKLDTEAYRKIAASQTFDDNIVYIDFFYEATDWSGTATEFGNFIDGTASADSGRLFSYIATGGWVKSGTASLFVSCQYTIN
jgi:hypothetical protein